MLRKNNYISYLKSQIGKKPDQLPSGVFSVFLAHPTFRLLWEKRKNTSFGEILEIRKDQLILDDGKGDEIGFTLSFFSRIPLS